MMTKIKELDALQQQLAKQALAAYTPLVDDIISTQNREENHIELTLDSMLSFCFDDKMLLLYRRLCRYLFDLNPKTAAWHITAFRKMWDEEGKMFGNKKEGEL